MKMYSRITGSVIDIDRTDEERHMARVAKMRRAVWAGVSCMARQEEQGEPYRMLMLTLTYKRSEDWHGRSICQCLRWCRRKGALGYTWVGELQKRGVIHYHVLVLWPANERWVKPTAGHGWDKGFTWVTDNVHQPMYLLKYIQKGSGNGRDRCFPKSTRMYGVSQSIVRLMDYSERLAYNDNHLPAWFREGATDGCVRLVSSRVCGGVANGRFVAYSPYARCDLPAIDSVGALMYNSTQGSDLLPQR